MRIDQKITGRFDELIERAENPETRQSPGRVAGSKVTRVDYEFIQAWQVNSLSLISRVFGDNSEHYRAFTKILTQGEDSSVYSLKGLLGIVRAAKEDYENGYLFSLQTRVTADVFEDFLEQAVFLLNNGFHLPAAVLTGAVLEDALRRLCDQNNVTFTKSKPTLNDYNIELPKVGVYEKATFKQVDWLGAIRNHAAHGELNKFTPEDVERMIPMVRDFMVKYFT